MVRGVFRIRLIAFGVFVLSIVYIARLFSLQVVRGAEFSAAARERFVAVDTIGFDRGTIYFSERSGQLISAATLKERYVIAINPRELADPSLAYATLSRIASTSRETFMVAATKTDDPYEEVGATSDAAVSERIRALSIAGLDTYRAYERYYPAASRAAHVLGFLGRTSESGDMQIGRYGLEQQFDRELSRTGEDARVNVFAEVFAGVRSYLDGGGDRGADIITTIEPTVQAYLESELAAVNEEYRGARAGGVIINPKTGEVYAMAAVPTFDPNNYRDVAGVDVYINPLVQHVYEMGSVLKPLTIAAGLDAGVITPASTYTDTGTRTIDGYTIANYDGKARGVVSIQEVLNQSLNLGTVHVAEQLGEERFREYFSRWRLGRPTGIELPGEASGLTDNLSSNRFIERASASYGQGIAMSPIAFVQALTALANDGAMVRPRVVGAMRSEDGTIEKREPVIMGLPIREETAETITRMLVRVVDEALLGGTVALPQYSIAAKTGTAQIAKPGGGYWDDRYLHSFFGYFPAYDPQFLIFLYLNEPQDVQYASQTLTHPFMRLATFLLSYYEVPPDRGETAIH